MRIKSLKIAIIVLALFYWEATLSQSKWQSALFIGGANYQGDLVESLGPYPEETGFAIGLINRYSINSNFIWRANLLFGRISGDDKNGSAESGRRERNFNFKSTVAEFSMALEWEPFALVRDSMDTKLRTISPYLFGGGGIAKFSPETRFDASLGNGILSEIDLDKNAEINNINFILPVGGGLKFNISKSFEIGTEIGARMTFSDYVDGISVTGNPETKDWYWFGGINLGLRFSPKDTDKDGIADKDDDCPKEEGGLSTSGCPDKDGDGVGDRNDLCPDNYGDMAFNGCPDSDLDGIVDVLDDCPDVKGGPNTNGCPDDDLDLIPNKEDECPNLAGPLLGKGCPLVDLNGNGTIEDEIQAQLSKQTSLSLKVKQTQLMYERLWMPKVWALVKW